VLGHMLSQLMLSSNQMTCWRLLTHMHIQPLIVDFNRHRDPRPIIDFSLHQCQKSWTYFVLIITTRCWWLYDSRFSTGCHSSNSTRQHRLWALALCRHLQLRQMQSHAWVYDCRLICRAALNCVCSEVEMSVTCGYHFNWETKIFASAGFC